jgi:hypothetical protein
MATQIQLQSTNYNGQIADITFYPCSGGTISLGNQTIPYIYTNDNYEGTYDLYFSAFNQTCQLVITCLTPTPTTTTTPTVTPTITPTNTSTPTITPTNNPLCPEQVIVIDNDPFGFNYNGTYDRLYSYTGGTFIGGTFVGNVFTPGPYLGNLYAIYGRFDGTHYYTLIYNTFNPSYLVYVSNTNYIVSNTTFIGATFSTNQTITDGSVLYPKAGFRTPPAVSLEYPISCPTPTPTITPTNTPGVSPTPTLTTTPTNTPTLTQTPTPSPGPSFDPDATTYINAVIAAGGTLTAPQQTAINTFYVGLKTDGIYNKFYYLHLFFGGTAGSNGINAKTPGTYNLSFQGTWTHSVSGSTTTQNNANYAESGFVVSSSSPSTTETDFSFGYMLSNRNLPLTSYQYMGIGTNTSNYMILGHDWIQADGITNFWSTLGGNNLLPATGKSGVWNSVSRSGSTAWYVAALFNGTSISSGLTKSAVQTSTFTPSATAYDLNLFRVNGLNDFTIGGNALLNYASTYLSPTEIDSFAQRANTLQVAFTRNIFT